VLLNDEPKTYQKAYLDGSRKANNCNMSYLQKQV